MRHSHSSRPLQPTQYPETPRPTQQPKFQTTQPPRRMEKVETSTAKSVTPNSSSEASPLQSLSQLASDPSPDYKYLRLEWSESDSKLEYTVRFNYPRLGFWLSSAPQRKFYFGIKIIDFR